MRVLVVDNQDSFVYNLVQLLRQNGKCSFEVVLNDRLDTIDISRFDKVLISPGPGLPGESPGLLQLIDRYKYTHPMLGICLGHQAIAEVFGARLSRLPFPKHGHEDRLRIDDRGDRIFAGVPEGIRIGRYHSWVVEPGTLPPELRISGWDQDGNVMSFYHAELPFHGLQFHPESVISECGQRLLDNWLLE